LLTYDRRNYEIDRSGFLDRDFDWVFDQLLDRDLQRDVYQDVIRDVVRDVITEFGPGMLSGRGICWTVISNGRFCTGMDCGLSNLLLLPLLRTMLAKTLITTTITYYVGHTQSTLQYQGVRVCYRLCVGERERWIFVSGPNDEPYGYQRNS